VSQPVDLDPDQLVELMPLLRRAAADNASLVRIRLAGAANSAPDAAGTASALVRMPFGVLVARTVPAHPGTDVDVVVSVSELLDFCDGTAPTAPSPRDAEWRGGSPPATGWRRIDTVPDDVIRGLVRAGAAALKEAAAREGVPDAQPRAEVADALLDSVVLTVSDGLDSAEISLRQVSAVTRMGFLPHGSHVAVDLSGRWVRLTAHYGSAYAERPGLGLGIVAIN
jgi:hypothetical protein